VPSNLEFRGRWADVNDAAGADLRITVPSTAPNPIAIPFNPDGNIEGNTAQVNGHVHTTIIHDWLTARGVALSGINASIPTTVNIVNTCNADYSSGTINFYRAGGGCLNTAFDTIDDGDLCNGTPHWDAINDAAVRHGLTESSDDNAPTVTITEPSDGCCKS
jgi:hypothetical protein